MLVLFLVSFIAVYLTFLEGRNRIKYGMRNGFFLVFFTAAIRDNYGNDFSNYLDWFTLVSKSRLGFSQMTSSSAFFGVDNGWSFLCYIFSPFGFNFFVAAVTAFSCYVFYNFIKDNVAIKWQWLGVFIYLFSSQIFVLGLSMMRQTFAITMFVLAYSFIKRNKIILPLIIMLLGTTIHSSAIITIPFLFINRLRFKNNRIFSIMLVVLYFVSIIVAKYTSDLLNQLTLFNTFGRYIETYQKDTVEFNVGIGYIVMQLPFALYVIYAWRNKLSKIQGSFILMSSIPYFLLAFKDVAMSERLGYYFVVFSIVTIPLALSSINKKILQWSLLAIFGVVTLFSYNMFFTSIVWRDKFYIYHTIFE